MELSIKLSLIADWSDSFARILRFNCELNLAVLAYIVTYIKEAGAVIIFVRRTVFPIPVEPEKGSVFGQFS
jgi:hypothetical protein